MLKEGQLISQTNISSLCPQLKHKIKNKALLLVWSSHNLMLLEMLDACLVYLKMIIYCSPKCCDIRPVSIRRWVHVLDTQKFPSFPRIRYLLSVMVVNYCVVCLCLDYHENYTLELSALWFSVCLTKEVNEIISGSPVSTALSRQCINRILFIYVSCIKPKFFPRICMFTGLIMLAQHTFANLLSVNCWNLEISLIAVGGIPSARGGAGSR